MNNIQWYLCPQCGNRMKDFYGMTVYCSNCGSMMKVWWAGGDND